MSALLQQAIRDVSERVQYVIYECDEAEIDARGMREARDLLRVLANIAVGMDVRKAFGAPGDWGYGNELGQGVLQLLQARRPVIDQVANERRRQVSELDYTETHDDEHDAGDLAAAGACYALNAACVLHPHNGTPLELGADNSFGAGLSWPWVDGWKPKTPRFDLVRAAALIVAEIERLDRAQV